MGNKGKIWLEEITPYTSEEEKNRDIENLIVFYFTNLTGNKSIQELLDNPDNITKDFLESLDLDLNDVIEILNKYNQELSQSEKHNLK